MPLIAGILPPAQELGRSAKSTASAAVDAGLLLVGLWLAGPLPVAQVGGQYDDFLFVRLANALLQGHWLGKFDELTLAKGPFYPLFLAGAAAIGIPIQVATACVYLAGALVLSRAAGRVAAQPWIGTLCLAMLVLNPACFDWSTTDLMREPLYCGLTLLVLGLGASLFLADGGLMSALALGMAGAAFWLTREEGIVLAPPLALMAAWYFWGNLAQAWQVLRRRRGQAATAAPAGPLVAAGTALALVLLACAINQHVYHVFRSTDFQSGPFPRAYGALTRIVPAHWQRKTPIARETRLRAYAVSPAFRELEPFLEGDTAHFAMDLDCPATKPPSVIVPECHDIPSESFMWALRDAVTRAGYYASAKTADGFYRRMARELNAACNSGTLACFGPRSGYLPPLNAHYAGPLLHSAWQAAHDVVFLGGPAPIPIYSQTSGELGAAYDNVTFGTRISPPIDLLYAPAWHIEAQLSSADPATTVAVVAPVGAAILSDITTNAAPDIPTAFRRPGDVGTNFKGDVRCQPGDCRLQLIGGGGVLAEWQMARLKAGPMLDTKGALLFITEVTKLPIYADDPGDKNGRHAMMVFLAQTMPKLTGLGVLPALAWLLFRIARDLATKRTLDFSMLGLALCAAVLTRILMLALLDATSIALQFRYEAPAMGPLICFVALLLGDCVKQACSFLKKRTKRLLILRHFHDTSQGLYRGSRSES